MAGIAEDGVDGPARVEVGRAEIAQRAGALAHGDLPGREDLGLAGPLAERIDAATRRAHLIADAGGGCEESRRAAALEFVAAVVTALTFEARISPAETSELVSDAAAAIGVSRGAANLLVFQRALASPEAAVVAPPLACQFVVDLLVALGPADVVSLWTCSAPGRLECVASTGGAAVSRRMRLAARAVVAGEEGVFDAETDIRAVVVDRWGESYGALVARGRPETSGRVAVYLAEASSALAPVLERERLFERSEDCERSLVSACERRLTRLGCDLHDGPLQEIVALADDLRLARGQVSSLLDADLASRVRGRFDDLEARLVSLDQGLRDISHAIRSTTAAERPLEDALRAEVDALNRVWTAQAQLAIDGDLSGLTASQKIVLYRVVQESLSNARRHSSANCVHVRVHSTRGYVSVTVSDDGCGFDVEAVKRAGRLGLTGVIERVRLLGGDIEIESRPGRGTRVHATLPRWSRVIAETAPVYAVTA